MSHSSSTPGAPHVLAIATITLDDGSRPRYREPSCCALPDGAGMTAAIVTSIVPELLAAGLWQKADALDKVP